jgi:acetoin utilization deacetylase AcuC-like enzyme
MFTCVILHFKWELLYRIIPEWREEHTMAIVYHKRVLDHMQWEGHPESPYRIRTMRKRLIQEDLWNNVLSPLIISDADVLKVHSDDLLRKLKTGGDNMVDGDTMLTEDTYGFAMLSASIAATAVRFAANGVPSFAMCRPPGHHAGRDFMGGFCYLNNIAIAVESAGVRTAIIDLDVHHGNGTEDIFYRRPDVLTMDIHESGLYTRTGDVENTGGGDGEGYTVNIPLPRNSGNSAYDTAMKEIVTPVLRQFRPELIVVGLGVDAHYCDAHSSICLNTENYVGLCKQLIAESGGNIAFVLEGGYHLRSTAEVVCGVLAAFEGKDIKPEYNETKQDNTGRKEINKLKKHLGNYWELPENGTSL